MPARALASESESVATPLSPPPHRITISSLHSPVRVKWANEEEAGEAERSSPGVGGVATGRAALPRLAALFVPPARARPLVALRAFGAPSSRGGGFTLQLRVHVHGSRPRARRFGPLCALLGLCVL
jgi:hypothetical protein